MGTELGVSRSILVLSIVIACFAVLWPKIFYPMLMTAVGSDTMTGRPRQTSPVFSNNERMKTSTQHPALMHPRMRDAYGPAGKPLPSMPLRSASGPVTTRPIPPQVQTGPAAVGSLGIIMPVYSILIVAFFAYTIFRLLTRVQEEEESQTDGDPSLTRQWTHGKELPVDPESRKQSHILAQRMAKTRDTSSSRQTKSLSRTEGELLFRRLTSHQAPENNEWGNRRKGK